MTPLEQKSWGRLQGLLHLPPLPGIAARLIQEVARPDIEIRELAALIEQDPGLAARIVGIANSAYFARQRPVCSVQAAIAQVLGLNLVRGIAIGITLNGPFDLAACPDFDSERWWYQAFQTAGLCATLAPELDLDDTLKDCMFLAGLLHNLGQLVLVHAFPARMSDIFREHRENPALALDRLETDRLAMDEHEAGAYIAHVWHLPDCIAEVMRHWKHPANAREYRLMVATVHFCARLVEDFYENGDLLQDLEPPGDLSGIDPGKVAALPQRLRNTDESTRALARELAAHRSTQVP